MTELADFSSLFQLGFGTGIALGLFQAPIRLRMDPLVRDVANETLLLQGTADEGATARLAQLHALRIDIGVVSTALDAAQRKPLIGSLIGAVINVALLIWASVDAQREMTVFEECIAILLSVVWFVVALAWMELIALDKISSLQNSYKAR